VEKKESKFPKFKIVVFVIFVALVVFVTIRYTPEIVRFIGNLEKFKHYITSFGVAGILVYILFEIIHVIIVLIPGEIIQAAGGYIYGTVFGTIYTLIGIFIGIVIVFFSTRLLGYSVVKLFISKEKLAKFDYIINSPKAEIIMFVLFLIPGVPKDALTYIAGLTPIKPVRFLVMCMVARFPGIFGSCYIGANLQSHHYITVIVVSGIAVILFILGVIFQDRIVNYLHKLRSGNKDFS
jgi:uncharacterized membrane protein YdjX (TVP38/TMEM64 family)